MTNVIPIDSETTTIKCHVHLRALGFLFFSFPRTPFHNPPANVRSTIRAPHRFSAVAVRLRTCAFVGECSGIVLGPTPGV